MFDLSKERVNQFTLFELSGNVFHLMCTWIGKVLIFVCIFSAVFVTDVRNAAKATNSSENCGRFALSALKTLGILLSWIVEDLNGVHMTADFCFCCILLTTVLITASNTALLRFTVPN